MEGFSYNTKMHSSMGGHRAQCYKTGGHVKRKKMADGGMAGPMSDKDKANTSRRPLLGEMMGQPKKNELGMDSRKYKRGGKVKKAMGGSMKHPDEKQDKALIKKELGKAKISLKRGGKPKAKKAEGGSMGRGKALPSSEKSSKPKKASPKASPTPKATVKKRDASAIKKESTPVLGSPQASMQLPPEVAGMGAPMMKHGGTVVHMHVGGSTNRYDAGGMVGAPPMGAGLDSAGAMGAMPAGDPRLRAQQRRLQMLAGQQGGMAGAGLGAGMAGGMGGAPSPTMPMPPGGGM